MRNIKTPFNFEPPATELTRDASLQFVRKFSGFDVPSFSRVLQADLGSAVSLRHSQVER